MFTYPTKHKYHDWVVWCSFLCTVVLNVAICSEINLCSNMCCLYLSKNIFDQFNYCHVIPVACHSNASEWKIWSLAITEQVRALAFPTFHYSGGTTFTTMIITHSVQRINSRVSDILNPYYCLSGLLSITAKVGREMGEADIKDFLLFIDLHKYLHPRCLLGRYSWC